MGSSVVEGSSVKAGPSSVGATSAFGTVSLGPDGSTLGSDFPLVGGSASITAVEGNFMFSLVLVVSVSSGE